MYKHFYNLKRNPFDKTIPTTEAFSTKDLTALTSRMDHLVALGGIGLVCAGPGFGKTFAMRAWVNRQNKNTLNFFYICLSTVTAMEFYRILCTELGLEPSSKKADMFRVIQQHLRYMTVEKGIRTVVVIDEAQYLRAEILRDLKMLTNFEMDSKNYLTLVLMGQPMLADLLSRPVNEALRQRVVVNYTFQGLGADEAKGYTSSLLRSAGADPSIFDDAAITSAIGISKGSVRHFNAILTHALMIGAQENSPSINAEMVLSASESVNIR